MKKILFAFATLFLLGSLATLGWTWKSLVLEPVSQNAESTTILIAPGQSLTNVANELQRLEVIRNPKLFVLVARWLGYDRDIKVGEYQVSGQMGMREILQVLASGRSLERKITFAEGLSIFDVAELMSAAQLGTRDQILSMLRDPDLAFQLLQERHQSLEGYLYPDTYAYTRFTTASELIRRMVERALLRYEEVRAKAEAMGFSRHQAFTFASIVEKETGAPEERRIISGVFHNRLQKRMKLQTDPTVLYAKALSLGRMEISIGRADLRAPHPYNTYVILGMPPGPIANPGILALQAAVNPEPTRYLFFVSRNDGTHVFSETYQEHNRAVQEFQKNPEARKGKSWRDLQKRQGN